MSWSTPLTALPHLSDEAVAAFADGVLSETARQRAQSHMAGCGECSDAVRGQRAASAFLRSAPGPSLPAGLLAKLRELPITAELPTVQFASALTLDGQPLFSSFGAEMAVPASGPQLSPTTVEHQVFEHRAAAPQTVLPQPVPLTPPQPMLAPHPVLAPHRHASTRAGLGAAAAAALAVGVLASTSATAGGVTPVRSQSSFSRVVPTGAQTSTQPGPSFAPAGLLVPTFNPSVGK